ncbi:MAG: DPP IV N-terminal domain-containing protein [Alistipes sp.]|nr:DPP IV N-terminal domain-containing protein [Alistipes sp.]
MKKILCSLWALLATTLLSAQTTFERANALFDHYAAWGKAPTPGMVVPDADGLHYTRLNGNRIERIDYAQGVTKTLLQTGKGVSAYTVAPDGTILVCYGAHPIYRHSFWVDRLICARGDEQIEVSPEIREKRDATLSPDGSKVLFSAQNDLYLFDLESRSTKRLTEDGCWNHIINGTTDWVYEEEFGFTQGYAFSPDSRRVAYLKFDESRVPLFEMMRFDETLYNHAYSFKYPKAGDQNSIVSLWVVDLATGEQEQIDTGAESDQYIPNLGWTPMGDPWFYRVDRRQRLFEVVVDRFDHQQIIYSESSPRYVERPIGEMLTFIDEDRFIVREETTAGWWHLYLHSIEKGRLRTLTAGEWEVTALVHADKRGVWYTSTEQGSTHRDLYRIDLRGKGKRRLTEGEGWHIILPGAGMRYFIDCYSSADQPTQITLREGERGEWVRTLSHDDSPAHEAVAEGRVPKREFFSFRTERGDELSAWVVKPLDFDPAKQYPVLLTQYSGPGSQEVSDRWRRDWTEALALEGYIVACVDARGTGFRGEAFKKQTYGDLGRREVEDQLSFARYWAAQSYVDAARIGIYGWSYGGFMALSCALKGGGLFKMAIAVAPVTSWR